MDLKLPPFGRGEVTDQIGPSGVHPCVPHHGSQTVKYGADGPAKSYQQDIRQRQPLYHGHGNGRARIGRT